MATISSVTSVTKSIPDKVLNTLMNDEWRIHTTDKMTQDRLNEYLAQIGNESDSQGTIPHGGRTIPVVSVPWEVVEFLRKKEAKGPYSFRAFHRPKGSRKPWEEWKKGKKTPPEHLRQMSHLFGKGASPSSLKKK